MGGGIIETTDQTVEHGGIVKAKEKKKEVMPRQRQVRFHHEEATRLCELVWSKKKREKISKMIRRRIGKGRKDEWRF